MLKPDDILGMPPAPDGERIHYGENSLQFGELRVPSGGESHPLAIVIHGGFWRAKYNLDHISHLCAALKAENMATWSLEYRRIGDPGGGWPGTFDDVRLGSAHILAVSRRYNLDCQRVVAIGHSAGGQLALWLGKEMSLRGIVALAPVADLRRAYELKLSNCVVHDLLGSPVEYAERYQSVSPIERLPLHTPQRLIHGSVDDSVPVEISRRYVAAAQATRDDAQLIELKNAGHFELIDPRTPEFQVVKDTVRKLCKTN